MTALHGDRRAARGSQEVLERQTDVLLFLQSLQGTLHAQERFWRAAAEAGVLRSALLIIPASGVHVIDWPVQYRAYHLANHGSANMTVANTAPTGASAPTQGDGVKLVADGAAMTTNVLGRTLAIWGTPGDAFNIEVFEKPQTPAYSPSGNCISDSLESVAPLGANATVAGAARAAANYSRLRVFAASDQAGTVAVQQSRDTLTWYTTTSQPVAAGAAAGTIIESILAMPYARAFYTNGATPQGVFELDTALIAV